MSQMDVIYSCSDVEAAIIRELCPRTSVFYVPPYAVDVDPDREFKSGERNGILFVGGFSHPPNVDGVLWFVREVWPAVQAQLPAAVFRIVGSDPPPEIMALGSDRVEVLGFATDERLEELYATSRLAVIPLRYGAGVKGKTVEAMAHGVPVVSTEWGVEGMPGVNDILDPDQQGGALAEGILKLYDDEARLQEISRRQRAYVADHFNIEKIRATFGQVITPARARQRAGE
jgi:glycosyltransferase involved in cell wall biosynthesis